MNDVNICQELSADVYCTVVYNAVFDQIPLDKIFGDSKCNTDHATYLILMVFLL